MGVTGGSGENGKLGTTEFIFPNGSVVYGPNLPRPRLFHCMVTLHNGMVMILGGYDRVRIYNPEDRSFSGGPSLNSERIGFGCTLFNSALHGNRPVVLAVGGNTLNTAEVLDYTNGVNTWEEIGSIPET